MNFPNIPEQEQITKVLSLLESTYSHNDTSIIKKAGDKLKSMEEEDIKNFANILLKCLSLSKINDKNISLDLHKSVALHLRNNFLKQSSTLKEQEIVDYLKNILIIYFSWRQNINMIHNILMSSIENIICYLLSIECIISNGKIIEGIFSDIIKIMDSEKSNSSNIGDESRLVTYGKLIRISETLLSSKSTTEKNFEELINKYFFYIADQIFDLYNQYIKPEQNMYNEKYIFIIKNLYDCLEKIVNNLKLILEFQRFKDISLKMFKRFTKMTKECIIISPNYDEQNQKIFEKKNQIIQFSTDGNKCKNINMMKSKIIQYISYLMQYLYPLSRDFGANYDDVKDEEIVKFLLDLIQLIVFSIEDLLSNQNKFFLVRNYKNEDGANDNIVNFLLYELCVLLNRVFCREPFKTNFRNDMKRFLLDILLPLISTNETEKKNAVSDFDKYFTYINDITYEFQLKIFRTSATFLVCRICENFYDECNYVLSYVFEMFHFTINRGIIPENELNYNIYLKDKNQYRVKQIDDEAKIDLFLLLIVLLRNKIKNNKIVKSHLKRILLEDQEKLNKIESITIKVKLFKVYSYYIPILFNEEQKNNQYMNRFFEKKKDESIIEEKKTLQENEKNFINNAIFYLLKNILQIDKKYNKDESEFYTKFSSDSLIELISQINKKKIEETELENKNNFNNSELIYNHISDCLSDNFKNIIKLIPEINSITFYNLMKYIVENIEIKNRDELFSCLDQFADKIKNDTKDEDSNEFLIKFFSMLSEFLKGKNKLNVNEPKEIESFENILQKIMDKINIEQIQDFEFNDEFINTMEDYILVTEKVNQKSIIIFDKIPNILDRDKTFDSSVYSFMSTFMKYFLKEKNLTNDIKQNFIQKTILIVKQVSLFKDTEYFETKKNSMLILLELFNYCINDISYAIFEELIRICLGSFCSIKDDDNIIGDSTDKSIINQIALANVSLGFIFRPEDTFKIIYEYTNLKEKEDTDNNKDSKNDIFKSRVYFGLYLSLLVTLIHIDDSDYILILIKCAILGLTSIYRNEYCLNKLDMDKNIKLILLNIFVSLINTSKNVQINRGKKITNKETHCGFIEDENNSIEESDEDNSEIEDISSNIDYILSENTNIKNADEFKYFTEIFESIKAKDISVYNVIKKEKNDQLNDLSKFRNVDIQYQGKNFTVPRRTVKIVKKK